MNALNVVIGGEAGQGLVTMGDMLAKAFTRAGYCVHVTQSYESRIRGGHNTYAVRAGNAGGKATGGSGGGSGEGADAEFWAAAPVEGIDLLIALDAATPGIHQNDLAGGGLAVGGEDIPVPPGLGPRHMSVPLAQMATGVYQNTALLGVAGGLLGLTLEHLLDVLRQSLAGRAADVIQKNEESLAAGFAWQAAQTHGFAPLPAPGLRPGSHLLLNGHEALVLGALSAGLKFYAFYPMSPATSVAQYVAAAAPSLGVVMEQGEDEIAVINMAVGASFAGAPSMVATSGGGFALMIEGVSLAAMTETPLVITVAMRPGPATGLPTRTEQADLNHVLHAGHGEFPRAIFAPGTPEQCFHLARQAFLLAGRYQGPVFILTDQYLSESSRHCPPFDLRSLPPVPPSWEVLDDPAYQRYAVTENGISPRALPGFGKALVVADSDEHTADGHLTEDLAVRVVMQEKRMAKERGFLRDCLPPDFYGPDDVDVLLVCWGSTLGAVQEAAARLQTRGTRGTRGADGTKVGVCHFSQVWPLRPDDFAARFAKARRVVMVESNATGQFANLIHSTAGIRVHETVLRYDGLPMTARYILEHLDRGKERGEEFHE